MQSKGYPAASKLSTLQPFLRFMAINCRCRLKIFIFVLNRNEYPWMKENNMQTLVLGLGNTLLGDEGIGVHVIQNLQTNYPALSNVTLLDGGTLSFTLASYIEDCENLIIIDAAQLHSPPGTIAVYEGDEMDRFINRNRNKSVHEVNVTDILACSHLTGNLPKLRALVGIQPHLIDWSDSLSEPVASAVPKACETTRNLIRRWQSQK